LVDEKILNINELTISFKNKGNSSFLVNGVSLVVKPGIPLTLMGETGCGKSLIANAVLDLLPPELLASGAVWYQKLNLLDCSSRQIRKLWGREIFLFPQEPGISLNPIRRSRHQLSEIFRWVLKQKFRKANGQWKQWFQRVGLLSEDGQKYPWQLSGGMNQRLLTAMALAEPAALIIADEPTKGLDCKMKNLVVMLMREMVDAGKSLFVITHDLEIPRQLGGDLAIMYGGMIMESGYAQEIIHYPRHPYTRALLAALPGNGLHPIPLKANDTKINGGCPFSPRCIEAVAPCFDIKPPLKGNSHEQRAFRCHLHSHRVRLLNRH